MTTAYTSLLGLALPVTGELSGTWGDTVNTAITSLLDTAVAGTTSITTDADITLTTTTGASNQARQAILLWNPASGTTTRYITAPAQSKLYTVINASGGTQSIVIRGVGPTTGVTIAKGESAMVAWNGSDFVKVSSSGGAITFTDLTVTGNTILGDAAADTLTVNATSTFASPVNFTGQVKLPSTGRSAAAALSPTNPAFLYGVASTYTDTTSSGTLSPVAAFYGFAQPTLSTSNVTTYTTAATLYVANAPTTGGSATITNPYALYVAAGANYFAGNATFASNVTLGDATSDTLTVNALVNSNLLFTDNTYDIGASGATRPRSIYAATGVVSEGRMAVGSISNSISLNVNRTLTGSASSLQVASYGIVQSDVTSAGFGFYSYLTTAAASFTLPSYFHHAAIQGTIGAGSAVTTQYGYYVDGNLTGATNNYGFYGSIASGTGRYNLYMGGTAANYLAGATTLNSTLTVNSSTTLNSNVQMYSGYLNISSGGSDPGTQLSLWSEPSGACYMAGYALYFNTGSNSARTTKMLLTNNGRLTVGQGTDAGFTLGVAGNVGVFDNSSNVSIGLQNTGSGGHQFRWLAGKTGDTFSGGFGFYDDTSLIYRMGVNSSGDVVFGSSSYSQLQNPSVALYPATGQAAIQAPTGTVAGLRLCGSSGSVAANMGGIVDFFAPYRTSDYDQYYTGRIFAYRENATNNAGGSYMGMQTSTAGFTSTYFLYADSSQRVSLNNKTLQTSYGLTSGRIYVDANGTDVTPTTGAAGLISVQGNGYSSYWTMDTNGLYIGTNSNTRNIYIGTKGSVNNNPASLTIDSAAENNTINANYYGVSIKSAGRQVSGYHIYDDVNGALWGLVGALTTGGTLDWNDASNAHSGQGYTLLLGTASNGPGGGAYYHVWNFEYASKDGTGNMTQWAIPYSAGSSNQNVFRTRYSGTWSSWYNF